ncbi:MAG TPA: hypothetical protein P5232_00580 [Candidatus Moranbacteria bacterium]|nr:hypothetical protein [Candidatus Moranbacteria bacterium]
MLNKIIIILFLIALGILSYFAYPIIKNRYLESKDQKSNVTIINNSDSNNEIDKTEDEIVNKPDETKNEIDESGETSNISAKDCDNNCENFKDSISNLKYCQDICNLIPAEDGENCENKAGTDKDYCLKNQAIAKTDLKICALISDSKIKSSCKNRVTEDLLEQQ